MWRIASFFLLIPLLALSPAFLAAAPPQSESSFDVRQRVLPEIGPGFRAIRPGPEGRYYVLFAPGAAVLIYDAAGKKLGQVPSQPAGAAAIVFGAALDVDAAGQVYVADRGGNAVKIYAADGSLLLRLPITEPTGIAALPGGEFAVSSLRADNLITVYDLQGRLLRTFGDPVELTDSVDLNRLLNLGYLVSDGAGNLYYAFEYLPEPTVRKFDHAGYLAQELSFTTPNFETAAQAARKEIARAKSGVTVSPPEIISAIGVDPASQDLWIAFGDMLMHCDPAGRTAWSARTLTPGGARLESKSIIVQPDRLLLGSDSLGLFAAFPPGHGAPAH